MAVLVHGKDGHPVRGARPQAEARVVLSHHVGEGAAARNHQQTLAAAELGEARAQLRQARAAAQAAAHLDDGVDHGRATSGLAASRQAAAAAGAAMPSSPQMLPAGSTARPRRPATSSARKAPTPAGATSASAGAKHASAGAGAAAAVGRRVPARHDLQEPLAHDLQLAFGQVARHPDDLGLAQHLPVGAHEAREALGAGGRRGVRPSGVEQV